MGWSLNEVRSLAVKAARGAGMSWGLSEEAGFSVHWLQRFGMPGALALSQYLQSSENGRFSGSAAVCPLATGVAISDGIYNAEMNQQAVRHPILIIPFMAVASQPSLKIQFDGVEATVSKQGFYSKHPASAFLTDLADVSTCFVDENPDNTNLLSRVPISAADAMAALTHFAQRTYAPATEASRLAGAGAGLSDND